MFQSTDDDTEYIYYHPKLNKLVVARIKESTFWIASVSDDDDFLKYDGWEFIGEL